MSLIKLKNVNKYYISNNVANKALENINLEFNLGEFVIITGASGSGKTTLLNVITGMDSFEEGQLFINEEDLSVYSNECFEEFIKKHISFVFQNYNLVNSFSVFQNIELTFIARGIEKKVRKAKVLDFIEKVGLTKHKYTKVSKLSGGERQRVSIARALATDAPVIACDEITGNLDETNSEEILKLLYDLSKEKLVLFVTHNKEESLKYATRCIEIHDGKIEKDEQLTKKVNNLAKIKYTSRSKIKNRELLNVASNILISSPNKLIFMTLIMTLISFMTLSLMLLYGSIDVRQKETFFPNNVENRIVVRKSNDASFSEDELNALHKIKGIKEIEKYGCLTDFNFGYFIEGNQNNYEFINKMYINSSSLLSKSSLLKGRMPINDDEIILSINNADGYRYLNKKILFGIQKGKVIKEFRIVGLVESKTWTSGYINSESLEKLNKLLIPLFYKYRFRSLSPALDLNGNIENVVIDNTLKNKTFIIENVTNYFITDNDTYFGNLELSFNNIKETISDCTIITRYKYDPQKTNTKNIYLSPDIFDYFDVENTKQINIYPNKFSSKRIINNLQSQGYMTLDVNHEAIMINDESDLVFVFENLFITVLICILIGLIIFVSNLIFKIILSGYNKTFSILKILGISNKQIRIIIYEIVSIITIASFFLMGIFFIVTNFIHFSEFVNYYKNLSFLKILVWIISILFVNFYIAIKFIQKTLLSKYSLKVGKND